MRYVSLPITLDEILEEADKTCQKVWRGELCQNIPNDNILFFFKKEDLSKKSSLIVVVSNFIFDFLIGTCTSNCFETLLLDLWWFQRTFL